MRRKMIVFIVVALVSLFGYSMLYNGFSGAESMVIQQVDQPSEEGKKTTDQRKIKTVIGILNRSNKVTHTQYKLAVEPTFFIHLDYKNKHQEILYFHEGFSTNTTLISSDVRNAYFKIDEKETGRIVKLLQR